MEFVYLVRDDWSKTKDAEMKLKCQKYSEISKEMTFFSDVLCLSRPYLEAIYTIYNVYFRSSP